MTGWLGGWCLLLAGGWVHAGDAMPPAKEVDASRYEMLWARSPFVVAKDEVAPETTEYDLAGVARFDGISYASLVEKKSGEHFLLETDRPARGLTLVSVSPGRAGSGVSAVVRKEGQLLTLKGNGPLLAMVSPVVPESRVSPFPPGHAPVSH